MIHYEVSFEKANNHLFDISLRINAGLKKGQRFYLPNWIPGSYMIRDFAKNIVSINAKTKKSKVSLVKKDKSSWQLSEDVENIEISYQVYAWDLSVRSAHLDNQHGFFNGTSLFLGIDGYEEQVHFVSIRPSVLAVENNWQVATAMPSIKTEKNGFGRYSSKNYDDLIDHPFEIGQLERVDFDVNGVPHEMYFTEAPPRVDWQRIANDVKKICETEVKFFDDSKPPFDRYVFMTFVQKKGFGGLEHMASTALHCSIEDLPLLGDDKSNIEEGYRTFLSLCCHEYFHCWNVKRIKPAKFLPFDLNQENYTQLLWFFEGITSYYDELLMARSKVVSIDSYLDMLAQSLTRVYRSKGRFKQTVTESSFDAWTKFYKQDENANNSIVSYYSKGGMVAFCLDFEIRRRTNNQKSLDDLMRLIWQAYGKKNKGLKETEVESLASALVGESMTDFFQVALYSTDELDVKDIFDRLNINFQVLPQYLQVEKGGFLADTKQRKSVSFLGITHVADPVGAKVQTVLEGTCAADAGLSNGDVIIAVENYRVTTADLDKIIARIPIGENIKIDYFRRDKLYSTQCLLTEGEANTVFLSYQGSSPSDALIAWVNA